MQFKKKQKKNHEPVLLQEVIKYLGIEDAHLKHRPRIKKKFVDATVGTAGHSTQIVKRGGEVLGIDADLYMLAIARQNLEKACPIPHQEHGEGCFKLAQGNFRELEKVAKDNGFEKVDGVLLDLGISSIHYKKKSRGFSFSDREAPLDMRIDKVSQKVKASDLLNSLRRDQLRDLFEITLNKLEAKLLVDAVISKREEKELNTVGTFLEVTEKVFKRRGKTHPATRAFLALRIAVNSELINLKEVLPQAMKILKRKGRLAVISFHSREDALVKKYFKKEKARGKGKLITEKPVLPSSDELSKNPKARSAKLRVLEKI